VQSLTGFCGRLCSAYAAPLQGGRCASAAPPGRRRVCAAYAPPMQRGSLQRLCRGCARRCRGCAEAVPRGARRCRGGDKRSARSAPPRRGAMSQSEEKSAYELERQDNMRDLWRRGRAGGRRRSRRRGVQRGSPRSRRLCSTYHRLVAASAPPRTASAAPRTASAATPPA
jgi:hypothetical protein